jgi:hypothetical protein
VQEFKPVIAIYIMILAQIRRLFAIGFSRFTLPSVLPKAVFPREP